MPDFQGPRVMTSALGIIQLDGIALLRFDDAVVIEGNMMFTGLLDQRFRDSVVLVGPSDHFDHLS
jgi:hypothetical protein